MASVRESGISHLPSVTFAGWREQDEWPPYAGLHRKGLVIVGLAMLAWTPILLLLWALFGAR
jgi:hypothetical protein